MNEGYVYFGLSGEELDPDLISQRLGINPTTTTRKGHDHWTFSSWRVSTEKIVAEVIDIYEMSEQILAILEHKAEEIGNLVKEQNLHAVLEVVLWISMDESIITPAIGFERRVIEFLHKTGAVIDIDTYRNACNDEI